MTKSDKSKHNICIASIQRSTMQPYDFKWTKFYQSNSDFESIHSNIQIELIENELVICSTIIDINNFSILTTQKLITKEKGITNSGSLSGAIDKFYGDFKGYKDNLFTFGTVQLQNQADLKYFIESGRASMIMIHGVRTLIRTELQTNKQVDKLTRGWNQQSDS